MNDTIEIPDIFHFLVHETQILGGIPSQDESEISAVFAFIEANDATDFAAASGVGDKWCIQRLPSDDLIKLLQQGIRDGDLSDGFVWVISTDATYGVDLLLNLQSDDPTKCHYCASDLSDVEDKDVTQTIPFAGKTIKERVINVKAEIHAKQCRVCGTARVEGFSLPLDPDHPSPQPQLIQRHI